MEYNVISGDSHIGFGWLPHDLFVSNTTAKWKDKVPQVIETSEGKIWFAEGKDLGYLYPLARLETPERGVSKHTDCMHEVGFFDGRSHPATPEMAQDYKLQYMATSLTMNQIVGAEFLASIVFSGALERYPGMKFVLGECGVSWIPHILGRMDEEYEDQFYHLNFSLKPSDYWRRQGYTTFQHETTAADVVHLVGEDNIIWGSDYPHPDGVWPDSRKIIEDDLGRLDGPVRRKITRDNAGKLYGILNKQPA